MTHDSRPLIAHVIHHLMIGGMENGLVNLINHLPEREFKHAVVCIDDHSNFAERIQRKDVEVIDLHRRDVGVWPVRRALLHLFRERRPRIVHTRGPSGLDALPPALLARVPHRIHGEHGWDMSNLDGRSWKPLWLRRLHSPLVDRYVAVSKDLQRYLVERVGVAEDRITTICNGVDTDRFCPGAPPADLGLPADYMQEGVLRIGTVGRLQPVKDQATLVAAAAAVVDRSPELRRRLRVVIVGDGPLRQALTQQVHAAGVADMVWFAGASNRVVDWLRSLDVFVLPSLNEGISNTLLEAMACGLPTLVTPVGGNVELLADGASGRSFAPGQADALATHVKAYLDDPALRRTHGVGARERAVRNFSLRTMVDRYGSLYRRFAEG